MQKYLTLVEASEICGFGRTKIAKWCQDGNVPGCIRGGSSWLLPEDFTIDLEAFPKNYQKFIRWYMRKYENKSPAPATKTITTKKKK